MRIKLIVNFILICNLDNGVMKSPKHRGIISLVFYLSNNNNNDNNNNRPHGLPCTPYAVLF